VNIKASTCSITEFVHRSCTLQFWNNYIPDEEKDVEFVAKDAEFISDKSKLSKKKKKYTVTK
jgi:hypothetical protein